MTRAINESIIDFNRMKELMKKANEDIGQHKNKSLQYNQLIQQAEVAKSTRAEQLKSLLNSVAGPSVELGGIPIWFYWLIGTFCVLSIIALLLFWFKLV